jgi:polysaccharide export outer membrane protein
LKVNAIVRRWVGVCAGCALAVTVRGGISAQSQPGAPTAGGNTAAAPASVETPPDYVIGPDDVLIVMFWRDEKLTAEVAVRPDGKISLPLLSDVVAAGLTPVQLRDRIAEAARPYVKEPSVTVVVKAINSRKVFVIGRVAKPGSYAINEPITVLQVLALAGGPDDYAKKKDIRILRKVPGAAPQIMKFNYKDAIQGKNLEQNILVNPGDTITVP